MEIFVLHKEPTSEGGYLGTLLQSKAAENRLSGQWP